MKRIYTTILIMLLAFCPQAQRFEWAKGYRVDDNYKDITGVVTDSLGNLYLLGACDELSAWDGEDFISPGMIPRGKNKSFSSLNVIIAKLSPEGDMIWKKMIFSNNYAPNRPDNIRKLGDTAIACLVSFSPSGPQNTDYTYFLDTFILGPSNYPIDISGFSTAQWTAYLVFDFDGNLTEQHYLAITYTDSVGNDLVYGYDRDSVPWLTATYFQNASFDVDSAGNIYISRRAFDYFYDLYHPYAIYDTIRGLKFWVDRRLAGEYRIVGKAKNWSPQIVKFSPHFDTMLACRYVFQEANSDYSPSLYKTSLKEINGQVLYCATLDPSAPMADVIADTIIIDSLNKIILSDIVHLKGYVIKYDNDLQPIHCVYLKDSLTGHNDPTVSTCIFQDIHFDPDSSLLFISGFVQKNTGSELIYQIGDTSTTINGNNAFVLSYKEKMKTLMTVPSIGASHLGSHPSLNNLYAKGNRVFLQSLYTKGLRLSSGDILVPNNIPQNLLGHCLVMFDYSGNTINAIDYNSYSLNNAPGGIVVHDSAIYLLNLLTTSARFGDIDFPAYGPTNCIAKYVDTAFMHPYVRPMHGITVADGHSSIAVHPNPARERLFFDLPAGSVRSACAISATGIRTQLPLRANGADISALAPGLYIIEIDTPSEKYHSKVVKL